MVTPNAGQDRQYALDFARGALEHYYQASPGQLDRRERATNLTTGDMLSTAIELLLDQIDPSGPKPWLHRPPASTWRPSPADQPITVTLTEVYGDECWHPTWPDRSRKDHP